MPVFADLAAAIGNTPLIRLRKASELTRGARFMANARFFNPGQSVKDRAALFMIRDAEAKGQLKPGGTIVEGTAGNTGIGLTLTLVKRGPAGPAKAAPKKRAAFLSQSNKAKAL